MSILGKFEVVSLGIHHSDYFQGFGSGDYTNSCVGIGDTEEAALEDCMEMMASSGINNFEERIRDEHGETDDVSICASCEKSSPAFGDNCANCDIPYFHVGIRWNNQDEDRLRRVKAIEGLVALCYKSFEPIDRAGIRSWGYPRRVEGSASYGDFKETNWPINAEDYRKGLSDVIDKTDEVYFFVPYASGSDYSGSTVEKANAGCIVESFGENEWVHDVHGGYSTYTVAIGLTGLLGCDDDTFDDLCEILEGLVDYPLINDEALSLLEMELADEAWKLWVKDSFIKALEDKSPDYTFDWPEDLRPFFEEKRETVNAYWECEGYGPDMHINIDDIVENIDFDDIVQWTVRYEVSYIDIGEVIEVFYTEDAANDCIDCMRKVGGNGHYRVVKPDHLKIEARQSAERRGHKMGPWIDINNNEAQTICMLCGKSVCIIRKPKPNEVAISGLAVARDCKSLDKKEQEAIDRIVHPLG